MLVGFAVGVLGGLAAHLLLGADHPGQRERASGGVPARHRLAAQHDGVADQGRRRREQAACPFAAADLHDEAVRRLIAVGSLGNLAYEEGDILWLKVEFIHAFAAEDAIRSELEEGGLRVLHIQTSPNSNRASAVCRKNLDTSQDA